MRKKLKQSLGKLKLKWVPWIRANCSLGFGSCPLSSFPNVSLTPPSTNSTKKDKKRSSYTQLICRDNQYIKPHQMKVQQKGLNY